MGLTRAQKAAFDRDGVIPLGRVLSDAELQEARTRFDRLFADRVGSTDRGLRNLFAANDDRRAQQASTQRPYQFFNIWEHDHWYRQLLARPAFLDIVESVLGQDIQLLHDQVFYKPAGDGAPTHWHRDNLYWRYTPPNLCSIWIALDDVDLENSCLHFVPGSHHPPHPEPVREIAAPSGVTLYELEIDERRLKPFVMPAGQALLHHCETIHGSRPNHSNRDRRSLGLHYAQVGIRNAAGQRLTDLTKCPILRRAPSGSGV